MRQFAPVLHPVQDVQLGRTWACDTIPATVQLVYQHRESRADESGEIE